MNHTLWLTDRSRYSDGVGFCEMARFLGYHFGPTGYGIQLKGTKLPLVTGIGYHHGLEHVLAWCRDHDPLIQQHLAYMAKHAARVPAVTNTLIEELAPAVRAGVLLAQTAYHQTVKARGFGYSEGDAGQEYLIREQCYLIEGMIWAWCLEVLPEVLARGRVLEVEHDAAYVVACTCGLGDGVLALADHDARGCEGIGLMCKPDFILETRVTKELEYHEFKGTGQDGPSFRDKWEVMIQMFAAVLDAERRLGRNIQSIYVHGLVKGKREGDYNPESGERDGFVRQQSVFCYGYRKPATPPMERDEWRALYEWREEDPPGSGQVKKKRLSKLYRKAGVWEWGEVVEIPEGMTIAEAWCRALPEEARRKNLVVLGPFSRQAVVVPEFLTELVAVESRWRETCWLLYQEAEALVTEHGEGYNYVADPRWQTLLHQRVSRSYECRRFGRNSGCAFEDVCFKREGWDDPLGTGRYIPRRPHHQDELVAAVDRGLLPPDEGVAETGED